MNKKAFTLTEVVISTLIVAILAAGMFSAFASVQYIYNRARHRLQAFNFAREALDRLRANYEYDSDPAMTIATDKPESAIGSIVRGAEMTNLSTTLSYDVGAGPQAGSYRTIEVKVTWDETNVD
jgi:prepilin-type N-terminal cleavage/methylation domain-containing protein